MRWCRIELQQHDYADEGSQVCQIGESEGVEYENTSSATQTDSTAVSGQHKVVRETVQAGVDQKRTW